MQTMLLPMEGCDDCPLQKEWKHLKHPKIPVAPPKVRTDIRVLVIGEGPGATEDFEGIPFVGETGTLLRRTMGYWADKVYFGNMIRCRPPDNRDPAIAELICCANYLEEDIMKIRPHAILLIGKVSLGYFWSGASIVQSRGLFFPIQLSDGTWIHGYSTFHPSYVARGERKGRDNAIAPVFRNDLERFFSRWESFADPPNPPIPPTQRQVLYPKSLLEVQNLFRRLKPGPYGKDFETFKLKPFFRDARLLTAAYSDGDLTFAFPINWFSHIHDWGMEAFTWVENQGLPWIAHNAGFELVWTLYNCDHFDQVFIDTQAKARLTNQRSSLTSLGDQTKIHLGVDIKSISDLNPERLVEYPLEDVLYYNGLDSWGCKVIDPFYKMSAKEEDNYKAIINSVESTAMMELFGLPVDLQSSAELKVLFAERRDSYQVQAQDLPHVKRFMINKAKPFSLSNPQDVGEILAEYYKLPLSKTPSQQQYSTAEEDLQELAGNPLVDLTLEFREVNKLITTYIEKILMGDILGIDGLLHPSYTAALTHTLRLSSYDPNIQNWPKRKHRELRRQVKAPKGFKLVSYDFGQLEARGICMASKDKKLRSDFLNHEDIHSRWMNRTIDLYPSYMGRLKDMTGGTTEYEIRKRGRDIIKTDFVFASFYGAITGSVAARTQIPYGICEQLHEEFWRDYSDVKRWILSQFAYYQAHGCIESLTGLVRNEVIDGNEPINNGIQGMAARLVLEAQNELYNLAKENREFPLMPRINVHDDLSFFLPDSSAAQDYHEVIVAVMTKARFKFITCPLMVEGKDGYNWCDLVEFGKFEGPYYEYNGQLTSINK